MYNYIQDPVNNNWISIDSEKGKKILNKYVQTGGNKSKKSYLSITSEKVIYEILPKLLDQKSKFRKAISNNKLDTAVDILENEIFSQLLNLTKTTRKQIQKNVIAIVNLISSFYNDNKVNTRSKRKKIVKKTKGKSNKISLIDALVKLSNIKI
tara:strand:- start:520 stop:978 length:459 start_codon:yes stop_codon:yes gene_type:complete